MIDRRTLLIGSAALGFTASTRAMGQPESVFVGPQIPFSFEKLIASAKELSERPYQKPVVHDPALVQRIDFDAYQQIRFRPELAIWGGGDGPYPIELFHVGRFFKEPVRIFVVSAAGSAQEVGYSPDLFTYGKSEFAKALPPDTGFAGFRILAAPGVPDWLAFLGASYFRSPAETGQYGLSSRGLAIDVAMPAPEEFPRFSQFWLEPMAGRRGVIINALLDLPRIAGAYRFETTHDGFTLMNVTAHLFPRADIERVGIGPLTSMYWYGKPNRRMGADWRPEIHDSDGLSVWTGTGERIGGLSTTRSAFRPVHFSISVRKASVFCSASAISAITRMMEHFTTSAQAFGSNPSATGGKALCNWWKFRRAMRSTTISSRIGSRGSLTARASITRCSTSSIGGWTSHIRLPWPA